MINIVSFIKGICDTANEDLQFIHGRFDIANEEAEKVSDSIVLMSRPYKIASSSISNNGSVSGVISVDLFFLVHSKAYNEGNSSINGYQDGVDTKAILPMLTEVDAFLTELRNSSSVYDVNSFEIYDITDYGELSNNVSGVALNVKFQMYQITNIC